MKKIKLLALSGSLRTCSYNTATIEALKLIADSSGIEIVIGNIKDLPLFNPDREDDHIPAVIELKSNVGDSSGLVIASPEYAHGISGPMKNALDWLVSGAEFPHKPIMLINASPRASHALAALKEVITTMSGNIIEGALVSIPLLGSGLDRDGILSNPEISNALKAALNNFCSEIQALKPDKPVQSTS